MKMTRSKKELTERPWRKVVNQAASSEPATLDSNSLGYNRGPNLKMLSGKSGCDICHTVNILDGDTNNYHGLKDHTGTRASTAAMQYRPDRCPCCTMVVKGLQKYFECYLPDVVLPAFVQLSIHPAFDYPEAQSLMVQSSPIGPESSNQSFEFFVDEEYPSRRITMAGARCTAIDLKSESDFLMIRTWITECTRSHLECGDGGPTRIEATNLPKRVINVGSVDSLPFLYEPVEGTRGSYLALSHCWGQKQLLTTSTVTLPQRKRAIPLEDLPKSFQDAIYVARGLGQVYLWIDSLCILQDSKDDWQTESAKMASVYRNALLTIAATSANDSEQGFLVEYTSADKWISIDVKDSKDQSIQVNVRQSRDLFHQRVKNKLRDEPLSRRGWTFQEQILSRRTVSFTKEGLVWQCKRSQHCSCHPKSIASVNWTRHGFGESTSPIFSRHDSWNKAVEEYSERQLTFDTDILPAISGLAANFQTYPDDQYLVGIWRSNLRQGLLWCSVSRKYPKDEMPCDQRCHKRVPSSPTWSWASVIGNITYSIYGLNYHTKRSARVIDAHCEPEGHNPWGNVSWGFIKLAGPMFKVKLAVALGSHECRVGRFRTTEQDSDSECDTQSTPDEDEIRWITSDNGLLDVPVNLDEITKFDKQDFFCFEISVCDLERLGPGYPVRSHNYLILRQHPTRQDAYERVGFFIVGLGLSVPWNVGNITIVTIF